MKTDKGSDWMLLSVAAIWGLNFVVMKFLLREISPINLILFRFILGSILLFLLLFFFEDVKIPLRDFFYVSLLGAIGITTYQFLFTYALQNISVTNMSIIINMSPLYGGFLSSVLGFEKFRKSRVLAILTGFAGVFIIITKGGFSFEIGELKWNLLAILSSVFWALYTILSKPILEKHSPLKVTAYSMITGSILLVFFVPVYFRPEEFADLSVSGWVCLAYAILFSIVIAFFLWYKAVSRIGPTRTIIYQYLVPVFATVFAIILIGEQLHWTQIIGAVIVFFSIFQARRG